MPQLMLELVMLWCFVCFGWGFSPLLRPIFWCLCYCINLYSFYYTQGSRTGAFGWGEEGEGKGEENFLSFSGWGFSFVLFPPLVPDGIERDWNGGGEFELKLLHVSFLLAIFPPSTFQRTENESTNLESIKHFPPSDDNSINIRARSNVAALRDKMVITFCVQNSWPLTGGGIEDWRLTSFRDCRGIPGDSRGLEVRPCQRTYTLSNLFRLQKTFLLISQHRHRANKHNQEEQSNKVVIKTPEWKKESSTMVLFQHSTRGGKRLKRFFVTFEQRKSKYQLLSTIRRRKEKFPIIMSSAFALLSAQGERKCSQLVSWLEMETIKCNIMWKVARGWNKY